MGGVGVKKIAEKMQKSEKIRVGVQNLGGKNPKYGKNPVVGVILGCFGKIDRTFLGFFPYPPPLDTGKKILQVGTRLNKSPDPKRRITCNIRG